jgi:DNA mismatch repair protein MutS
MTQPLFSADSIGKSFGSHSILRSASVWAESGEITALFGRNGCGKSTLLKIGAGVLRPASGAIHFDGAVYLRPRLHVLASHGLFFLPQRNLLSSRWTFRQHLAALEWRHGSTRTEEVLAMLGLADVQNQRPHEMSGGERRRAEMAIAWIRQPRCLLADEPFSGVNPATAEKIALVLRTMAQQGCAIVVTGHEVKQVMAVADQIVWMTAGTTHSLGGPDDALRHDQFAREYLGETSPTVIESGPQASTSTNGLRCHSAVLSSHPGEPRELVRKMRVDAQTLDDLEILTKGNRAGLIDHLCVAKTRGGRKAFHKRLLSPFAEPAAIVEVQDVIRFLAAHSDLWRALPKQELLDRVEKHQRSQFITKPAGNLATDWIHSEWTRRRDGQFFDDAVKGIEAAGELYRDAESVLRSIASAEPPALLERIAASLRFPPAMAEALEETGHIRRWSARRVLEVDRQLREQWKLTIERVADAVHQLDALGSMAETTRRRGFVLPKILDHGERNLAIEGLVHPMLVAAVAADLSATCEDPLLFITGPNMSGKTTYMKAAAIAVYLAQTGMGVPATGMRLFPFESILSGINTTDDVQQGYSYFLAEVRRVKEALEMVAEGARALILFDEMFKGTNVKDAYDASLAVTRGFTCCRNSVFLVSSHLVELIDPLEELPTVQTWYFDADLVDGMPCFSHQRQKGHSNQRLGMSLLAQEGVVEMLSKISSE